MTLPNLNFVENDQINDPLKDQISDQLNDLDLRILSIIHIHPGIKVLTIQERLLDSNVQVTENQIRNSIKRKIHDYIDYKGSKKTGGYYVIGK